MSPRNQPARLYRERDRRLLRSMAAALGLSACLVGGVLGVVGFKVNQVRASYRLNELRLLRNDLEELNRQLRVEQATLSSLARIESVARVKLGMAPPLRDQVRIAREYVGGSGAETTDVVRTAWEAPFPSGSEVPLPSGSEVPLPSGSEERVTSNAQTK